jgi:hypothetical protein
LAAPDDADLDRALEDYVAAFRRVETPSQRTVDRTWAAISADTSSATARFGPVRVAIMAVAAAVLLLLAWSSLRTPVARERQRERTQAPYEGIPAPMGGELQETSEPQQFDRPLQAAPAVTDSPAPSTAAHEPSVRPSPGASDLEHADRSASTSKLSRAKRAGTAPPGPARPAAEPPSALAEETALLGRIHRALGDGRAAEALELAAEHARRFPRGVFARERSVAKARALCALDRRPDARAVADAFVRAHPGSHLVEQMASICR